VTPTVASGSARTQHATRTAASRRAASRRSAFRIRVAPFDRTALTTRLREIGVTRLTSADEPDVVRFRTNDGIRFDLRVRGGLASAPALPAPLFVSSSSTRGCCAGRLRPLRASIPQFQNFRNPGDLNTAGSGGEFRGAPTRGMDASPHLSSPSQSSLPASIVRRSRGGWLCERVWFERSKSIGREKRVSSMRALAGRPQSVCSAKRKSTKTVLRELGASGREKKKSVSLNQVSLTMHTNIFLH
jgi:hypothetical protein